MSASVFHTEPDPEQCLMTEYDTTVNDTSIMIAVGATQPNASTKRVAAQLDCDVNATLDRLHELAEQGRLQRDMIGCSYVWTVLQ
jgi:predicted transcriptional regulator